MDNLPIQGPVFLIEVDKIEPNPLQPRRDFDEGHLKELATSIREFGILQPIVVTKIESETPTGTDVSYQLIAGERRWLAAKMIGMERIPAVIRNVELDRERLELAVIENVQRADLNPIEAARAYAKLSDDFKLTQREIAAKIGKSREVIANTLRLLNLPTPVQEAIAKGQVSESQARMLLTVENLANQNLLFEDLLRTNMSVRELKNRIDRLQAKEVPVPVDAPQTEPMLTEVAPDPELASMTRTLEELLGAKVRLKRAGATGEIAIQFYSSEELRTIIGKMLAKLGEAELE